MPVPKGRCSLGPFRGLKAPAPSADYFEDLKGISLIKKQG